MTKRTRKPRTGLSEKERRFVDAFVGPCAGNATQAATAAGYSKKSARQQGARLCTKAAVQAAILRRQTALTVKAGITRDAIAAELAKCGFANMGDYMRPGKDGDPYLDFSRLTRDQTAALAEVTVEDYVEGRGDDTRDVKRVKFRLVDKRGALVDLAKLLGFFKEQVEHSGKVTLEDVLEASRQTQEQRTR